VGGKLVTVLEDDDTGNPGDGGLEDDSSPEGNTLLAFVVCTGDAGGVVPREAICVSSSSHPGPILVS
jgi:hypothetical protein